MDVAESYQLELSSLIAPNKGKVDVSTSRARGGNGTSTRIKRRKLLSPNAVDTRNKLSNYVVGKSNLQAYNVAQSIVLNPSLEYPFFIIVAPSGLGKTHLIQGMINGLHKYNPEMDVLFFKGSSFLDQLINKKIYLNRIKAIFVDDFDDILSNEIAQKEFCGLFDQIRSQNIQLVISMSVLPKNVSNVYARFNSRISSGVIEKIDFLDRELGESITRRKLKEIGFSLREDIVTLIADSFCYHVYGEFKGQK
jgi:chromosomal replication initiator protein